MSDPKPLTDEELIARAEKAEAKNARLREALEMAVDQMVASAKYEAERDGCEYREELHDPIVFARAALEGRAQGRD